eukprot:SAG22_NODE_6118_length_896_cov_1.148055_2_plen_162_part_01
MQRELLGPPGVGQVLTQESNLGELPVNMSVDNPEPTSGRGRMTKPVDKSGGAEATRMDKGGKPVPITKFEPELDQELLTRGKKAVATEVRTENSAARPPKVPQRAQPYKVDKAQLGQKKPKKPLPKRWQLGPVHVIPDLRGHASLHRLTVKPLDLLTEPLAE